MTTTADEYRVRDWVLAAGQGRITALVGAGISTDSGIPDFRGPNGVWTRNPQAQHLFTLQNYIADPAVRRLAWQNRATHPAWQAEPNAGHRALVALEKASLLRAIITQNIDGLHQRAGNSAGKVIEIHGTMFDVECLRCARITSMRENLERVAAGDADPACLSCGGIQKSATISFGQPLRADVLRAATQASQGCDLLLAVGSTLQVHPAAALAEVAARSGARLVIVNRDPTPYDDLAVVVLREPIGEVLPRLVAPIPA